MNKTYSQKQKQFTFSKPVAIKQNVIVKNIIRPKLKIGAANDKYEQEADRVADQIMRMPAPSQSSSKDNLQSTNLQASNIGDIQRKCTGCIKQEELIQKKSSGVTSAVTPATDSNIWSLQGGGQPLSQAERGYFEPRFGTDFSDVRLHTDNHAASAAKSIGARAFTHGNNVAFATNEYSSSGFSGRHLLAHELTHVLQQKRGLNTDAIQRRCNTKKVNARLTPANLPMHADIIDVYSGSKTIKSKSNKKEAILLIQQALADLNYKFLGKTGRNREGVDGYYKTKTAATVKRFQKDQGILESGVVDKQTIRCLDEASLQNKFPITLKKSFQQSDVEIEREKTSNEMEVFFKRNKSILDAGDKNVIAKIAFKFLLQPLKITGFQSEDEIANTGNQLAKKRADNVAKELKNKGHLSYFLIHFNEIKAKPKSSIGLSDYPGRRKVEIEEKGKKSSFSNCAITPPGWSANDKGRGPCDKGKQPNLEATMVKPAIKKAQQFVSKAYSELVSKNSKSKQQVKTWFGSKAYLNRVKRNMKKWKKQLDTHIPAKHLCANECHSSCDQTDAYNNETGAAATLTLCEPMLKPGRSLENRAETIVHEAGHGAIDTSDIAYDTTRLINFLSKKPSLALKNTDSYVRMILCLNNKPCSLPPSKDTFSNINKKSDQQRVIESLSYLERWTDWAWQDLNGLFAIVEKSRKSGKWPDGSNDYNYLDELNILFNTFGWHRPKKTIAATTREKIFVSSVHERLSKMSDHTQRSSNYKINLDSSTKALAIWQLTPSRKITLTKLFFRLGKRSRVRFLLTLLIKAERGISPGLVKPYRKLIEKLANKWHRLP